MEAIGEERRQDIERLYAEFNRRDIEAVLERLSKDVHWANGMEGGYVDGRDAVRDYWTRQFKLIDGRVEPEQLVGLDRERVAVRVHQTVHSPSGELLADEHVTHVFTFHREQITRFDIEGVERWDEWGTS